MERQKVSEFDWWLLIDRNDTKHQITTQDIMFETDVYLQLKFVFERDKKLKKIIKKYAKNL